MGTLKKLQITNNVSEAVKVEGNVCAIRVETTETSTITVQRSIDNIDFSEISDVSYSINGKDEFNLADLVPGQYLKVVSTGAMTSCKILM